MTRRTLARDAVTIAFAAFVVGLALLPGFALALLIGGRHG